jgi:two-component system response regulator
VANNHKLVHGRRPVVLLAEDADNDVELTKIAFEHGEFAVDLHVTRDGEQCLAFLRKQAAYANSTTPDIILLDLHMPRMGGMEVLEAINSDEQLRHIPVIVLTTSSSEREIFEAYKWRCGGYVVKPVGFADFANAVQRLEDYWFALVKLPSG